VLGDRERRGGGGGGGVAHGDDAAEARDAEVVDEAAVAVDRLGADTGEPAHGCRSVTIVARTATLADALDTGIFILGPEKGMALIERLNGVEGVIVTSSNNVLVSSGLAKRLVVRSPPTDAP